jgi:hypothetical protein
VAFGSESGPVSGSAFHGLDTDPDCDPDSDADSDPDGWRVLVIFGTVTN